MQGVGRVLMLHKVEAPVQQLLVGMAGVVLDERDDHACCASMPWPPLCWPALVQTPHTLLACRSVAVFQNLQTRLEVPRFSLMPPAQPYIAVSLAEDTCSEMPAQLYEWLGGLSARLSLWRPF